MAHSIKLFLCLAALAMLSICIQAAPVNVSNDVAGHDGATDLVQQITLLPLDDVDQKTAVS